MSIPNECGRSEQDTAAFWAWFEGSRVCEESGEPRMAYHGTRRDFTTFCARAPQANPYLWQDNALGFFFTAHPGRRSDSGPWSGAAGFAGFYQQDGELRAREGARILAVYLCLRNPVHLPDTRIENGSVLRRQLEAQGYDGVITDDDMYVAFYPEQIKSALANCGRFDPRSPDMCA